MKDQISVFKSKLSQKRKFMIIDYLPCSFKIPIQNSFWAKKLIFDRFSFFAGPVATNWDPDAEWKIFSCL